MDRFTSASLVKALLRSYWRAQWRIGDERARCLHKYLSFDARYCQSTRILFDWGRIPGISRTLPGGRTKYSQMQSRKSLGANWNDGGRRKRLAMTRDLVGAVFLMAKIFSSFLLFSVHVYLSFFSSSLAFRVYSSRMPWVALIFIPQKGWERSTISPSSKDDRKGGWRGRCCEEKFLNGINALLQLRTRLSNILAYFLVSIFNACLTKFNLLTSSEYVIDIIAIMTRFRACIKLYYYLYYIYTFVKKCFFNFLHVWGS